MKTINLNTSENIRFTLFPDNQPHVNVGSVSEGEEVDVVCSLTDSMKMMHLLQVSNALDNLFARKKKLFIPYLMGARYDRSMQYGDSIDIKVVADLVNSCGFEKVLLLDVHSPVATLLIRNSVDITNRKLVEGYDQPEAVLICPDTGAARKVEDYFKWNKNLVEIVYCKKQRALASGHIDLEVMQPEKCRGRNCVIIDDICDGGATFLAIAGQIQPAQLSLIVTHGIFSKGFGALEEAFDEIIVSDSLTRHYDSKIIKQVSVPMAA